MSALLYSATLRCDTAEQGRHAPRVLVRLRDELDDVLLTLDPREYLANYDLPPFVPGRRYRLEIREA